MKYKIQTGLLITTISLFGFAGQALAQTDETSTASDTLAVSELQNSPLSVDLTNTGISTIKFESGMTVALPAIGESVRYRILYLSGQESTGELWVNADGSIGADEDGIQYGSFNDLTNTVISQSLSSQVIIADPLESTDLGCLSSAYLKAERKFNSKFDWWYDPTGEPSTQSLSRIQEGLNLWRFPVNRCTGQQFNTAFEAAYQGTRIDATNGLEAECGPPDGKSTVSWKTPIFMKFSWSCEYKKTIDSTDYRAEVDVKFNKNFASNIYFESNRSMCPIGKVYLVTIAGHEFGHALGLLDVATELRQLMSSESLTCTNDYVGLAPGDYLGLLQIYGLLNSPNSQPL